VSVERPQGGVVLLKRHPKAPHNIFSLTLNLQLHKQVKLEKTKVREIEAHFSIITHCSPHTDGKYWSE